jgi:hypothetical protein
MLQHKTGNQNLHKMVRHSGSGRQSERRAACVSALGLLVELPEADGPRRIDVGVKEALRELALWRLVRVILGKFHGDLKKS